MRRTKRNKIRKTIMALGSLAAVALLGTFAGYGNDGSFSADRIFGNTKQDSAINDTNHVNAVENDAVSVPNWGCGYNKLDVYQCNL